MLIKDNINNSPTTCQRYHSLIPCISYVCIFHMFVFSYVCIFRMFVYFICLYFRMFLYFVCLYISYVCIFVCFYISCVCIFRMFVFFVCLYISYVWSLVTLPNSQDVSWMNVVTIHWMCLTDFEDKFVDGFQDMQSLCMLFTLSFDECDSYIMWYYVIQVMIL